MQSALDKRHCKVQTLEDIFVYIHWPLEVFISLQALTIRLCCEEQIRNPLHTMMKMNKCKHIHRYSQYIHAITYICGNEIFHDSVNIFTFFLFGPHFQAELSRLVVLGSNKLASSVDAITYSETMNDPLTDSLTHRGRCWRWWRI